MQHKVLVVLLLSLLMLAFLASTSSQAMPAEHNNKVVFILMDNITWSDIIAADDSTLNDLIKKSSIGVMNNRALKAPSRPRNALTAGAGIRADISSARLEGYNTGEKYDEGIARDTYRTRTGRSSGNSQVVELGIASIVRENENGLQEFVPGQLADILESFGKRTAVLGNSDTSLNEDKGSPNREAVSIAMNSKGLVRYGDVGKDLLKHDPKYPFGVKTDHDKLETLFKDFYKKADFIVIDLGDTARADFHQNYAYMNQAVRLKKQAIHYSAEFIERAMKVAGKDTVFMITALSPPGSGKSPLRSSMEQMTPMIIHGPGFNAGGLISDTTRRDGLIAAIDIAPTVLNTLGLPKSKIMSGSPMRPGSTKVSPESLDTFNQNAVGIKAARRTAVLAFIYFQILLYALAAIVLAYRRMLNRKTVTVLETMIFTIMGFPLFSFYVPKFGNMEYYNLLATGITIAVSLAFAVLLVLIRRKVLHPVIGISALTIAVLSVDALMGAESFGNSIFGYDLIRGSRFYGVGNEAMSIFIANALLLFGVILEKAWNKWTIMAGLIICAAVTVIIGFPAIGANTGGTIAAVFAFATMFLQVAKSKTKTKARNVVFATAAVATVLGLFVVYDVSHGATSHMGKTVNLIMAGGVQEIFIIIKRKVATNLMVLRYSTWSYFLLITLGLLAFLWFKPVGVLQKSLINHKGISASISAAIVGGVAGFVFNDSGILIPAIIMSYMIPTVVYLMIWERYHPTG